MDTLIGKTLSHYRIVEKIGAGGMGEVYRAQDTRLERDVAIKALPEALCSDPERVARFEREARALASLNHPNIAAIYGLEEVEGRRYLALELVKGETLAARITRGPLPPKQVIEVCCQIASGIEAAHEQRVIHRDLKPGNVMITGDGVVKVLDFGLAKVEPAVGAGPGAEDLQARTASVETMPGIVMGTAAYLSPEQASGKVVDRRTDIWSFGCLLYECLTGRRPFRGDTPTETIGRILERDPDWSALPAGTPPGLLRLLQRCLEKDPKRRLRDMGDARLAVEELKAGAAPGAHAPAAATPSIAVLPFADLSPGRDQEYFSDGLSEELINVLSNIRGLRVVSRTSAFFFKGKDVDLATVAQKLNVAMVLEGSVRKAGNRLRITAQLIEVGTDSHLWSQTYDRELRDIFAIQEEIALSVVKALRPTLLGDEAVVQVAKRRVTDPEAHRLSLLARHLIDRGTREDTANAIGYLKEALVRDPESALAWADLGWAYAREADKGWSPVTEGYGRAREAVARALALEPDLPEGHARIGWIRTVYDWDFRAAEESYAHALELSPGNGEALRGAAALAVTLGNLEEAIGLSRRALEQDPLSALAYENLGAMLLAAERFAEAEAVFRRVLELSPQRVGLRGRLSRDLLSQGRGEEALADALREPAELARLTALAIVYHGLGQGAKSDAALRELIEKNSDDSAYQIAEVYGARGEVDRAFEWLERARAQRDGGLWYAKVSQDLRSLHDDPRWAEFLRKLGLED